MSNTEIMIHGVMELTIEHFPLPAPCEGTRAVKIRAGGEVITLFCPAEPSDIFNRIDQFNAPMPDFSEVE